MAKKKNKQKDVVDDSSGVSRASHAAEGSTPTPASTPPTTSASTSTSNSTKKVTTSKSKGSVPQPPTSPQLIICRNKHWRYISSFHGPWLQLPPEILETLANTNYSTPRPRPIDPAVFYDLAKIRRLVDDSTNLAVRAATGIATSSRNDLGLGFGGGGGMKLSAERKYRTRVEATQKLSRAYHLDEIACSVATMQSASTLEDVASLVLQRNPNNPDAKYVHFFHEKIPSRQLAESTSLTPLDEVIAAQPTEGEPLRTRATVRVFKEDYEGAGKDLTEALQVFRLYKAHKTPDKSQDLRLYERNNVRDTELPEDQQPSSLEIQLQFQRAGVYLNMACMHVADALVLTKEERDKESEVAQTDGDDATSENGDSEAEAESATPTTDDPTPEPTAAEKVADKKILEARKIVKANAKKALRDYMAYLGHFDYSPNLPVDIAEEFTRKVTAGKNSRRRHPSHNRSDLSSMDKPKPHTVYTLNQLFAPAPPSDLPPYPPTDIALASSHLMPEAASTSIEMVTYHPLLTDALHALLLCHTLVQTSTKELLRHAYMVARLARLADGYPIFQASRSPARADWIEVLRRQGDDWIKLSGKWEDLCAPAPLPLFSNPTSQMHSPNGSSAYAYSPTKAAAAKALPAPNFDGPSLSESSRKEKDAEARLEAKTQERNRIRRAAIIEALEDERVHDEASLRASINARQRRAEADLKAARDKEKAAATPPSATELSKNGGIIVPVNGSANGPSSSSTPPIAKQNGTSAAPPTSKKGPTTAPAPIPNSAKRWACDDGREYPILTERAAAVARWVREAPAGAGGTGTAKRKKKGVKKSAPAAASATNDDDQQQ